MTLSGNHLPASDLAPAPRAGALVRARNIGVRRDGRWLIRHVDLDIARGEIVTCIGPNGGGKTTLAKTILGVVAASEGTVETAPGITVGYVPQRLSVDRTLPLSFGRLMRLTTKASPDRIEAALGLVGASALAGRQVHTLSGGELQRALVARAIVREPDLLVLDEPVQGVDYAGEIALYELIGAIRDRLGCGILLISHDLHIVMAATDTVICLNGHICCSGAAEAVAGSEAYRALFGRRGAAALAIYHHEHDHAHGVDGTPMPIGEARAPGDPDA